ncbi:a64c298c-c448-4020-9b7d-0102b59b8594 [Sclerotinia trifoliorum]|uniref:A64c298c-c448-4020-9b7d-0102b59b8594 n=1 Tax=Sclerotinia trifoliorum TaxID=28548 RepID=A0A8H2VUE7_9HELO|nr:a64c298c-c448-4020-9b7d-0102b59b8594 [Sclerotinia trifoliorum]
MADDHNLAFQIPHEVYEIPLRLVTFPFMLPDHVPNFSEQGWSTLAFSSTESIHVSSQKLLQASRSFFDLPPEYKSQFLTGKGTEEGWNRVEGEKEFITLREASTTPPELLDAAKEFWEITGDVLNKILGEIASSLGMKNELLVKFSEPCSKLQDKRTATMIRLFRYEGDGIEGKVVSEPHRDLGLLSLSISDAPGLEVLDVQNKRSFPIEKSYVGISAGTLLVGRELEFLSNGRYHAAGHSVRIYPKTVTRNDPAGKEKENKQETKLEKYYRYSIVFVLRGHEDLGIDTDELRTPITGRWKKPMKGLNMEILYRHFLSKHVNINSEMEDRQEQRRKLHEKLKGRKGE